jgi:hypothetical protein
MKLGKFDLRLLSHSLRKQAEILRDAGAHALADRMRLRGQQLQQIAVPVRADGQVQRQTQRR